jgi:CDP-paratose 2-epimerase
MAIVIVTGSAGLIGAEATRYFHSKGMDVVGIDNDMRRYFFGDGASTRWSQEQLERSIPTYRHHTVDIRDAAAIDAIFQRHGDDIVAVIHTAAQPSHDWAAREPVTDFTTNANGTLNLLEATRKFCERAVFIFTSTNKVYGDTPNRLPLVELETRWELSPEHPWAPYGIPEDMSIDQTLHSLFGASKVAADVLVQEYGRYFGMRTAVFRGGCLTGPGHSGAELHGFLSYLMKCAVAAKPYTVFGYKGKQVRDNIHSHDLVSAFWHVFENPRSGVVYNMGGGRFSNCSMIEAIGICEDLTGRPMDITYQDDNRVGDHIWWISDTRAFQRDYPNWRQKFDLRRIMEDIHESCRERVPAE